MKKNTSTPPSANQASANVRQAPSHDEISQRARDLWEKQGRPTDRDNEIWLEAERQLLGTDSKARNREEAFASSSGLARRAS